MKIKEVPSLPETKLENETCDPEIESLDVMGKEAKTAGIDQSISLIDKPHQLPNIETETIDLKETYANNIILAMQQVKPEKCMNKEVIEHKENERKETTSLKDTKNASPAIPHKKLLTDRKQELPDDKSGVSR
jgi:hypothetical protein